MITIKIQLLIDLGPSDAPLLDADCREVKFWDLEAGLHDNSNNVPQLLFSDLESINIYVWLRTFRNILFTNVTNVFSFT